MRLISTAVILAAGFAGSAAADVSGIFGKSSEAVAVIGGPPSGYANQHWVDTEGCSYSRAQTPGKPATWHLVLNGDHVGLTNAHKSCTVMYREPK